MAYPVPEIWTVSGSLDRSGVPFSEGKVYVDNLNNGEFEQIAESGISADGSFTLTYSRGNFQNGDASLEFPTIRIRVEDYQGNRKALHVVSAAEKKYQKLMDKAVKIQETVEKVRDIASATFKMPDFKFGALTNAFGGPASTWNPLAGRSSPKTL